MENTPLLANNPMVFLVLGLVLAVLIWWISTLRIRPVKRACRTRNEPFGQTIAGPK